MNRSEDSITVSVVVVTYNHEDYIGQCLASILEQKTNFNFEIIIGEDDSSDGTREICQAYAKKYPDVIRLFLRSRKDVIHIGGRPTGRFNFLESVKEAKGKYIALLDGDDYWTSQDKLQMQVDILEGDSSLIAVHHWQKVAVQQNTEWIEVDSPRTYGYGYCADEISSVRRIFQNHLRLKTRTILFRNIITPNFFPDWIRETAFADIPLSFLLGKFGDYGFIDQNLAVYRRTSSESVSTAGLKELGRNRFKVKHYKDYIEIWDRANAHYSFKYNSDAKKTIKYFYQELIKYLPNNYLSYFQLIVYNFVQRPIPFYRKWYSTMYLSHNFLAIVAKKAKGKIKV